MTPEFRIVQLDYPMPLTGFKFFIDWKVKYKKPILWGLFSVNKWGWERFIDATKNGGAQGYLTQIEALHAINVYKNMMTPIYHYVN